MKLSIDSIVKLTLLYQQQLDNPKKSFRLELKQCSVETTIDNEFKTLDTYVNGVLVFEDEMWTDKGFSATTIILMIEDIELFLNDKLNRTKY